MGQCIMIDILDSIMLVQKLNLMHLIHNSDGAFSVVSFVLQASHGKELFSPDYRPGSWPTFWVISQV